MKRTAKDDFQPFLAEAYAKGVPEPGACLKLFYNSGLNVSIDTKTKQNKYQKKNTNFWL